MKGSQASDSKSKHLESERQYNKAGQKVKSNTKSEPTLQKRKRADAETVEPQSAARDNHKQASSHSKENVAENEGRLFIWLQETVLIKLE